MVNLSIRKIICHYNPGVTIDEAFKEAIALAMQHQTNVLIVHNDKEYTVDAEKIRNDIYTTEKEIPF